MLIILSIYKIGITDKTQARIQAKNLFLFRGFSSVKEKAYAQITIGKNEIKKSII